jgi:hypothetical protein
MDLLPAKSHEGRAQVRAFFEASGKDIGVDGRNAKCCTAVVAVRFCSGVSDE